MCQQQDLEAAQWTRWLRWVEAEGMERVVGLEAVEVSWNSIQHRRLSQEVEVWASSLGLSRG